MRAQLRLQDANLSDYLRKLGLIRAGEALAVEPAGEGNINWVRRARCPASARSWVVKQARPALERFPEYRVSTERIVFEARYYACVRALDRERLCPEVVCFDPAERVLVLEDAGDAERLDRALARGAEVSGAARALGALLGAVHAHTRDGSLAARFENGAMRRLHGDHIFHLPYRPNDFPLSPAVRACAERIAGDRSLVEIIDAAYARYLECADALVHADVQPTNVLLADRPRLLDAEIAHLGDPAFDVGILLGHLLLHGVARGDPAASRPALRAAWSAYAEAHGAAGRAPFREIARYAGIELLRRTVGAARVEAVERDEASLAVIDRGIRLVADPPGSPAALAEP